ncbi:hypothetical protein CCP3SC1AL1_610006 [Gammaproteobacteria bacterium]
MKKLFFLLSCTLFSNVSSGWTISSTPLFLASQATANIFFELDDSGSMDWTILAKNYWHPCAYDPDSGDYDNDSSDCGSYLTGGDMTSYGRSP